MKVHYQKLQTSETIERDPQSANFRIEYVFRNAVSKLSNLFCEMNRLSSVFLIALSSLWICGVCWGRQEDRNEPRCSK